MKTNNTFYNQKFLLVVISLLFFSCAEENSRGNDNFVRDEERKDSIRLNSLTKEEEKEIKVPRLVIKYSLDSLVDIESRDSILGLYTNEQQRIIFAINRIEQVRVGVGTKLVIPDTILADFNKYAPFPQYLEILDSIPKVVVISQRVQAFGLFEKGNLIRSGPVSSGKQSTPTPNGLHYGNYKAKRKISTVNDDWILPYYFNFMNFEGVGVHQYLLPGFPASHACVRLYIEDAKFIYDWAHQWKLNHTGRKIVKNGTPFMVYGEYDYQNPFPWLQLSKNPDANALFEEEVAVLRNYVEDYFKDEKNFSKLEGDSSQAIEG